MQPIIISIVLRCVVNVYIVIALQTARRTHDHMPACEGFEVEYGQLPEMAAAESAG